MEKSFKNMISRIGFLLNVVAELFKSPYFGFIKGHSYLNKGQLRFIKSLVNQKDDQIVKSFEIGFSKIVGSGNCVSYASGRMGFYDLMKSLDIGYGDEVILLGATCAVMSSAVLRTGAIPVYSDIDPNTFGSSAIGIESCITRKTKMIVAQHSFGIPCDIEKIQNIASSKNIFLLEDCALTLGSSVSGIVVGNFGNAAIFSTDHSKPINTMIGGMVYSKDKKLITTLRLSRDLCNDIPLEKQNSLWRQFLIEKMFCNAKRLGLMRFINLLQIISRKLFNLTDPFLSSDYNLNVANIEYPYPSKMPTFLAQLGLYEISRWESTSSYRKEVFESILRLVNQSNIKEHLPLSYEDTSLDIIPLRFVWSEKKGSLRRDSFSSFINVNWTWFMQPIVSTKLPLYKFRYINESCPLSELIGKGMVNLPCNIHQKENQLILKKIKQVL